MTSLAATSPNDRTRAGWALRDSDLPPLARLVWLTLDKRGADPRPSLTTLAHDCGLSRSATIQYLAILVDAGWLRCERRRTEDGDADTNRYFLLGGPSHGLPGTQDGPRWSVARTGVVRVADPKVETEVQSEENLVVQPASRAALAARAEDRLLELLRAGALTEGSYQGRVATFRLRLAGVPKAEIMARLGVSEGTYRTDVTCVRKAMAAVEAEAASW